LVQAVWRKFEWGFADIATSFRWCPKNTLNLSLFKYVFHVFHFTFI
jgi:hypothetical protein